MGTPLPLPKRGGALSPIFGPVTLVYCGEMVGRIKTKLDMRVGLGPGHIVLDGDPAPLPQRGTAPPPIFGPCLLWPNGRPSQLLQRTR